jgi:hypothetical protein
MANLTPTQKRNLLSELLFLKCRLGYDITGLVGHPLSKYNFDAINTNINLLVAEWEYSNEFKYEPYYLEQI